MHLYTSYITYNKSQDPWIFEKFITLRPDMGHNKNSQVAKQCALLP